MSEEQKPVGLRARRRALTEREIEDAAIDAFETQGFAGTTMEHIAVRAGVSVRTAFRYFPTKVDTVLFSARQVSQVLGDGLRADLAAGASLFDIEESITASLTTFTASSLDVTARLKRAHALVLNDEQLRTQVMRSDDYLAGLDDHDTEAVPRTLEARLLIAIVTATLRTAFDDWARSVGEDTSLVSHYRRARAARDSLMP
ncbi:TetR/AcrR family transcriptional regulator [Streptomyces sp. CRN 30]|uniref:TetR/AcrR family transcriptional regulator n=1 Tax=Streptomyces sp. CRN 30 TaxID=3075613 RepID=UPI002A841ADD|nr:TetR/AcrR family transcriptional regulator [Streptomyces sp. CRN 30]